MASRWASNHRIFFGSRVARSKRRRLWWRRRRAGAHRARRSALAFRCPRADLWAHASLDAGTYCARGSHGHLPTKYRPFRRHDGRFGLRIDARQSRWRRMRQRPIDANAVGFARERAHSPERIANDCARSRHVRRFGRGHLRYKRRRLQNLRNRAPLRSRQNRRLAYDDPTTMETRRWTRLTHRSTLYATGRGFVRDWSSL